MRDNCVKVLPRSYAVQILNVSREKTSIQASQRRMERKLKELNATLDQERIQHVEQRDQVNIKICIQNFLWSFLLFDCWLNAKCGNSNDLRNKRNILTFIRYLAES